MINACGLETSLEATLLKCWVDWTDLDPTLSPGTFSDLSITAKQLPPLTQHTLCLKQSCFLLPRLEKFPLALQVTTKEGKGRGEVSSAAGWIYGQGSLAARLRLWFPSHLCQTAVFLVHPSSCLEWAENLISGPDLDGWTIPHSSCSKSWLRTTPWEAG